MAFTGVIISTAISTCSATDFDAVVLACDFLAFALLIVTKIFGKWRIMRNFVGQHIILRAELTGENVCS